MLILSTPRQMMAARNNLLVTVFPGELSVADLHATQREYLAHAAKHREGVLVLTIVEQNSPMPESLVRVELGKLLELGAGKTRRSAVVYEGEGFRAAAVRGVVTGLNVFTRSPYPHKVFGAVGEACAFLAEDDAARAPGRLLESFVADVRKDYLQTQAAAHAP